MIRPAARTSSPACPDAALERHTLTRRTRRARLAGTPRRGITRSRCDDPHSTSNGLAIVTGRGPRAAQPHAPDATREVGRYSAPRYYEIAFDMNRKQEVDFLVHCFRRYSRRPVKRVLDIACGTGPHLIRLAARGYRMSGLDLSPQNIDYLRERARGKGFDVTLHVADMTRFRLPEPLDAAICMQDSQGHLLTNEA